MTIQPIANQATAPLNLLEVLNSMPHVFENICTNFDPQTMKNFLSTCKRVRQINNELKEEYPKTYSKLLDRIFPHAFCRKSIEQLSDEMVELCTNIRRLYRLNSFKGGIDQHQLAKFKDLLNALIISGKFDKIDKCKLESTFLFACNYGLTDIVELFINSSRYHDISIDRLNKAFKVWSLKDGGKAIQTLISSDRFREITPKSLGSALRHASDFACADVVRAIMESGRVHEISLEDFGQALELVVGKIFTTIPEPEPEPEIEERRHEILHMFSNFPQFNKVSCVFVEKSSYGMEWVENIGVWNVSIKPTESK